jgi:hypothetical protein
MLLGTLMRQGFFLKEIADKLVAEAVQQFATRRHALQRGNLHA